MAWTTPTTRVNTAVIDATIWNTDIVNNLVAVAAGAHVYHSAAQTIANNAQTALNFDSERYDTDVIHDTATNNTRLTCKTAGKYRIYGGVQWAGSNAGFRQLDVRLNGVTSVGQDIRAAVIATEVSQQAVSEYLLAVNDYVELVVYHNSGGALNVNSGSVSPLMFSMHFVSG